MKPHVNFLASYVNVTRSDIGAKYRADTVPMYRLCWVTMRYLPRGEVTACPTCSSATTALATTTSVGWIRAGWSIC